MLGLTAATNPPWVPSPSTLLWMVTLLRQSVMLALPFCSAMKPAAYLLLVWMVPPTVQPSMVRVPHMRPTSALAYWAVVLMSATTLRLRMAGWLTSVPPVGVVSLT